MSETAIRGVVHGDSFQIIRTVGNLPDGETVDKAWLTVKERATDSDADAALSKEITEDDVPGLGLVDNSTPGSVDLRFDIAPEDWDGVQQAQLYRYDIQIKTSGGGIYTAEIGTIVADEQITRSTS
jgi:hypothetical protein